MNKTKIIIFVLFLMFLVICYFTYSFTFAHFLGDPFIYVRTYLCAPLYLYKEYKTKCHVRSISFDCKQDRYIIEVVLPNNEKDYIYDDGNFWRPEYFYVPR